MKKNKKVKYVAKLTRVMDEGESFDEFNHIYGKATNRLNELHQDDCPRVRELGRIIDIFVNTIALFSGILVWSSSFAGCK